MRAPRAWTLCQVALALPAPWGRHWQACVAELELPSFGTPLPWSWCLAWAYSCGQAAMEGRYKCSAHLTPSPCLLPAWRGLWLLSAAVCGVSAETFPTRALQGGKVHPCPALQCGFGFVRTLPSNALCVCSTSRGDRSVRALWFGCLSVSLSLTHACISHTSMHTRRPTTFHHLQFMCCGVFVPCRTYRIAVRWRRVG